MKHVKAISRRMPCEAQIGPLNPIQLLQIFLPIILEIIIPFFAAKFGTTADIE